MQLNWNATPAEHTTILAIARRAEQHFKNRSAGYLSMDIEATHCNGCPLDLWGLLEAGVSDFLHDITGIVRHLDRRTGRLTNCFLPRYAARS